MQKLWVGVLCVLVLLAGCRKQVATPAEGYTKRPIPHPYERVWVMSGGWQGTMGVAIALSHNRYYYWFYSDAKYDEEPTWPIVGTYTLSENRLTLSAKEGEHLYATTWLVETNGNRECLWAERDVGDYPRMLIPDPYFDPKDPFANQELLKAEPSDAADSRQHPAE